MSAASLGFAAAASASSRASRAWASPTRALSSARRFESFDSSTSCDSTLACCCARSSASSRALASRASACMTWALRAASACLAKGPSCLRNSAERSSILAKDPVIDSSLRRAFSFRRRCLRTPAASSMNPLRSSAPALSTSSSLPWPMMTCISRPMPVSERSSWMSSSLQDAPLIAYSDPPLRKSVLEIVTSV